MSVKTAVRRMASSAIITGAMLASSAVVAHAQPTSGAFYGNGGNVSVRFAFADAGNRSELRYRLGPYDSMNPISSYTFMFANKNPNLTAIGTEFDIGIVAQNQEVIFMLNNTTSGFQFYTGDVSRNPIGELHVSLFNELASGDASTYGGTYDTRFGFEDVTPLSKSDEDYNDLQYEIANVTQNVVPEPSAVVLMAAGLMGLGVAARRRRKV